MRKIKLSMLTLALLLTCIVQTFAQFITVLPNDNSTSGNGRAPSVRFSRIRCVYLIKATEMAASGFGVGNAVGGIGWTYQATGGLAGVANLNVYLENTSDVTNNKSTTWATAISPMTLVHTGTTTLAASTTPNVNFSGGSPFTYTGGGVYVAYDWGCYGGTLQGIVTMCNSAGLANGLKAAQQQLACPGTPSTTLNLVSAFRPETRLYQAPPNNDLGITHIYMQGTVPVGYGVPETIKARITNNGTNTMAATTATLTVSGTNSFILTTPVPSLASGAAAVVTFPSYSPTLIGSDNINVAIPADDVASNNSKNETQATSKDINSYLYPASSVTGGVGFTGATGDFIGRFFSANNFSNPDTINGFRVVFTTTTAQPYQVGVWNDNSGVPGTNIYTSATQTTPTVAGTTVFISLPDVVVSGTYYVGIRQTGTTNVGFGYQTENPIRAGDFFFTSPTGNTSWTDFNSAGANFRISATVQYKTPQPPSCAVYISPTNTSFACQNGTTLSWGSGGGGPTGYRVYFGTNQALVEAENAGTLVQNNASTSYATGALTPGATYYWRVTAYNVTGDASGCATLSQSFTTNLVSCYCTSTATNGSFEFISNVTGNVLNNTTASSLYANYVGIGAVSNAHLGATFNLSVTVTNPFDEDRIYVYADLNHDGDWSDAGELIANVDVVSTQTLYSVPCVIPIGATPGTTLLRIKMGDEVDPTAMTNDPCQTSFTYGEVEDYLLNLTCGATSSGNSPVCENGTINLSSTYFGAGTPTTYSWTTTAASGFTSGSQNTSVSNVTPANDAGTYNISITDNNGCVATSSVAIVVNAKPQPVVPATASVCVGTPLGLSSNNGAPGQGAGNSFSWTTTAANGFTSLINSPTVTSTASANDAGTYTVVITNANTCTASASTIVSVNANPSLSIVSTTGVSCVGLCDGGAEIGATLGLAPYLFTDGSTFNTDGIFTNEFCEGSNQVDVTDDNGCQASIIFSIGHISAAPPTAAVIVPPIVNLPAYACNGTLVNNINVPAVPSATKYIWDGPAGTSFNGVGTPYTSTTGPNANITFGNPTSSGYLIGVQAANGCGTTLRKVQFVRGIVSTPAAVSGAATVCASSVHSYSTGAVGGATSYSWYAPAGFSITDGTNTGNPLINTTSTSVSVTASAGFTGASTGSICVTANTPCYSTAQKCMTISTTPSVLGQMSGVFTVCPNTSQNYSVPQAGPGTYAWTLPPNTTGSSSTYNINVSFLAGFTSGNITVVYTNECGQASAPRTKSAATGVPSTPSSISGPANGICGQPATYICPGQAGVQFSWSLPSGSTFTASSTNSQSATMPGSPFTTGQVCVSAVNLCGSSAQRCISVKGAPNSPGAISTTPGSWCAPSSSIEFLSSVSGLGGSYSLLWAWIPASAASNPIGQNTNDLFLDWDNAGSAVVSVTASNACGQSTRTLSLNVGPCATAREMASENTVTTADSKFVVYPNPASSTINVDFESMVKENVDVVLMDLSGRTVMHTLVGAMEGYNHSSLDVTKVAKGVYMMQLKSENSMNAVRIVIE